MEIQKKFTDSPTNVLRKEIPIGAVFSGKIGITNSVFFKTFSVIVDLNNPHADWRTDDKDESIVYNYVLRKATLILE